MSASMSSPAEPVTRDQGTLRVLARTMSPGDAQVDMWVDGRWVRMAGVHKIDLHIEVGKPNTANVTVYAELVEAQAGIGHVVLKELITQSKPKDGADVTLEPAAEGSAWTG